ncbi:MAG: hypothetical protein OXC05_16290 [Halieaceae bacterium]|nr:hypothetical protein [Halieaceae bacterium]
MGREQVVEDGLGPWKAVTLAADGHQVDLRTETHDGFIRMSASVQLA